MSHNSTCRLTSALALAGCDGTSMPGGADPAAGSDTKVRILALHYGLDELSELRTVLLTGTFGTAAA